MHRRSLLRALSVGAVISIGGCLGDTSEGQGAPSPNSRLVMYPVSDSDIAVRWLRGLAEEDASAAPEVMSEAVTNGSTTFESRWPPIDDGEQLVYNGTVYRVSRTVEEQRPITVYPIKLEDLDYDSVTAPAGAKRIEYANLPAVDREKFRDKGFASGEHLGIGTSFLYTGTEESESVLVPEPEYSVIVWRPNRRGVFSIRQEPHDDTLSTYRYSVDVVKESAAAFGRARREEYVLNLTDLPPAQEDIVTAAVVQDGDGGYYVPHDETPTEPFDKLAERFQEHPEIPPREQGRTVTETPISGTYIVSYDGQAYWTGLAYRGREN